jgi:16S rRNA (adenine1518-N6/adenine1519-N6)-dimethyltransferase
VTTTPKRSLGQHFLVDENLLHVIGRLAGLRPDDVVLEIGPGTGVLTVYLADRVRAVHAIELDRSLGVTLEHALGGRDNVRVYFADAVLFDYGALSPKPRKLVSNLPYNVATPIVVESLEGVPTLEQWCVMVQREVADRFFARPRTKAYGAVSVLVQLAAERTGIHRVSPSAFRPRPKVESAIVAFRRVPGPPLARLRPVVEGAFAHRRKTLANSLSLSGLAPRSDVEDALRAIGKPPGARAEELSPEDFVQLADALA